MSLPWIRLDTTLGDHPKMLALMEGRRHKAALAYIFGLTYSGRHELDGFIPSSALPFIHATKADASALIEVGMWAETRGGYQINGWSDFQVSNEESRARRDKAQKAAMRRWHGDGK
jgi:predicted house-cleaning NTP pyrophosphatase (Maf/HAM1 superfamily)